MMLALKSSPQIAAKVGNPAGFLCRRIWYSVGKSGVLGITEYRQGRPLRNSWHINNETKIREVFTTYYTHGHCHCLADQQAQFPEPSQSKFVVFCQPNIRNPFFRRLYNAPLYKRIHIKNMSHVCKMKPLCATG